MFADKYIRSGLCGYISSCTWRF